MPTTWENQDLLQSEVERKLAVETDTKWLER